MAQSLLDLSWPFKGLIQNNPLQFQEPGSTTDCLNVRNYDTYDRRRRGGQRTGMSKYFTGTVNGSNDIQRLHQAVEAFDPTTVIPDTLLKEFDFDDYPSASLPTDIDDTTTTADDETWEEWLIHDTGGSDNGIGTHLASPNLSGNRIEVFESSGTKWIKAGGRTSSTDKTGTVLIWNDDLVIGTSYVVRCTVNPPLGSSTQARRGAFGMIIRIPRSTIAGDPGTLYPENVGVWFNGPSSAATTYSAQAQYTDDLDNNLQFETSGTNLGSTFSVTRGTPGIAEIRVFGNNISFYWNGNQIGSFTSSNGSSNVGIGFALQGNTDTSGTDASPWIKDVEILTGLQPASLRSSNIIAVTGGSVYHATPSDDTMALAISGSSAVTSDTKDIGVQTAFQNVFFTDGVFANYQYMPLSSKTMTDWTAALTAGSLPRGSTDTTLAAKFMQLYRGRVVLFGLQEEPHNWFMSVAGDPFDWDYSPATSSATQAVAGNNSDAGELGDVMTAFAPYSDDIAIMGGANSLWVMRGDPAAGGAIDNITYEIGIVGPDAWTYDTAGNLYFLGVNGLYRLENGGYIPTLISQNKLDKAFADIDYAENRAILVYDPKWQGVHVFLSPSNEPSSASRHYFWDQRDNAFWPDEYPVSYGPSAVLSFKGDQPADTAVLLGGYDSGIRYFDPDNFDDDGTVIPSRVRLTPIVPGGVFASARIEDFHFVLDQASDAVTLKVFTGDTVEEAERRADAGTPITFSRTLKAGRNNTIRNRVAGNAIILELSQSGTAAGLAASYAYEAGGCKIKILSRMKGRHVS